METQPPSSCRYCRTPNGATNSGVLERAEGREHRTDGIDHVLGFEPVDVAVLEEGVELFDRPIELVAGPVLLKPPLDDGGLFGVDLRILENALRQHPELGTLLFCSKHGN